MMAAPMLADFAVRLAFGLSIATVLVPWRAVPLPFFRTQAQIILGLLALAALDQARSSGTGIAFWTSSGWRAGLCLVDRVGAGAAGLGRPDGRTSGVAALVWLTRASRGPDGLLLAVNAASRAASGFLLGAVLCSMLLGHYYLTAPAMTIDPLKRTIVLIAWGLGGACGPRRVGGRSRGPGSSSQASVGERSGRDGAPFRPLGHGVPGRRHRHLHDVEDGPDSLDAIGDGHPLHHHDLRLVRRAMSLVLSGRYGVIC